MIRVLFLCRVVGPMNLSNRIGWTEVEDCVLIIQHRHLSDNNYNIKIYQRHWYVVLPFHLELSPIYKISQYFLRYENIATISFNYQNAFVTISCNNESQWDPKWQLYCEMSYSLVYTLDVCFALDGEYIDTVHDMISWSNEKDFSERYLVTDHILGKP